MLSVCGTVHTRLELIQGVMVHGEPRSTAIDGSMNLLTAFMSMAILCVEERLAVLSKITATGGCRDNHST